ncbi:winged helix-turn-helix domain-containing protein [Agrococcus sp. TSP3-2-1]|uniref:winged helix-turn-helix domain-containing protein n=1 Tax=Agrococcus sp. TSP3-2-1 TaxID=2804583 RepID=UPI003CE7ACB8
MTLAPTGHATVVAVGEGLVRGRAAEHRFHHFHVVTRPDPIAALAEAARNDDAVLLIPSDLEPTCLESLLELANHLSSVPVLLALRPGWVRESVGIAVRHGVTTLAHAPVTPSEIGSAAHHALLGITQRAPDPVRIGALVLDPMRHTLTWADQVVNLQHQQIELAHRLMTAHPGAVSLSDLQRRTAQPDAAVTTVRTTIARMRRAFDAATDAHVAIEVVPRVGYRLRVTAA